MREKGNILKRIYICTRKSKNVYPFSLEKVEKYFLLSLYIYKCIYFYVIKAYSDAASENLQYFEDTCATCNQEGIVKGLFNLTEIGMCGFLHMTNSNDANALANQMKKYKKHLLF